MLLNLFFRYNVLPTWMLFFGCLSILLSCTDSTNIEEQKIDPVVLTDFSNILNLIGAPDSATDRSVFAFSDLGAWVGYGLPSAENPDLYGSFTGPFLMTQDNGVWISPTLSQLEIINTKTGNAINLVDSESIEINSYPGKLRQVFWTKEPELLVVTELIFVTDRTALIRLSVENPANNPDAQIQIRWSGKPFLDGVSFLKNENRVEVDFLKNENIGNISIDPKEEVQINIKNDSYEILTKPHSIKGKDLYELNLAHSFCFSKREWEKEQSKLKNIFQNPHNEFSENKARWDAHKKNILANLNSDFKDTSHQKIAIKCLQTLTNNWRSPAGFLKHEGLFPSYNYEWFNGFWSWDSWKHAVAIAYYDTNLAQNQIRAMYDFQDKDGMIADCVYRDTIIENHNWRDTKPPLSAWAVWEVFQKSKDLDFLKELFPKIEKYHEWWYQFRDINQNGLCEYGSTDASLIAAKWESGMDNAVRFDEVKILKNNLQGGSINCESVDLNAYLYAEKKYLAKIANELGEKGNSDKYLKDAKKLQKRIQEKFYNEESGWFFDFNLEANSHIKIFGSEGWIPLWANLATAEQAAEVRITMMDATKFATYIPFPTLAADHPKFKPKNGYWRGPVWLDQAYFAIQGLKNYGYEADALQFSHHLFDRLEGLKNDDLPIRENYHPLTGEGLESNHFSWSAAHLLMLLMEDERTIPKGGVWQYAK